MPDSTPKSYLDLVKECDNFPHYTDSPSIYLNQTSSYYRFHLKSHPDVTLGFVLPHVAETLTGLPDWSVDPESQSLTLLSTNTHTDRSAAIGKTCLALKETGHFGVLKGWRNELYPVYGPNSELLFDIERSATPLFGVVTYGSHMTAYTYTAQKELKIWVPRRSKIKSTYPGQLDNTVAGGLTTGEVPLECIVREAQEEAGLPEDYVRQNVQSVGVISYFHVRDERAGGETGLLQPEVEYVYDLELAEDMVPKPADDEVEEFYLWGVDEVREAMGRGEFKPNCSLVLIDFMIRRGMIRPESERDYLEICCRLHRKFEFPTGGRAG